MEVKTATFNGVNYEIQLTDPVYGSCDPPQKAKPTIFVAVKPHTRKELEILLHESLHASCWAKSEDLVTQTAADLVRLLWRLGYRRK